MRTLPAFPALAVLLVLGVGFIAGAVFIPTTGEDSVSVGVAPATALITLGTLAFILFADNLLKVIEGKPITVGRTPKPAVK